MLKDKIFMHSFHRKMAYVWFLSPVLLLLGVYNFFTLSCICHSINLKHIFITLLKFYIPDLPEHFHI